ncbi:MAG TPA: hypothetical protein VGD63_14390 [Steroidobacteraceae bacterium]
MAGATEAQSTPNLEGIWILPQTAPADPRWQIEDFLCNGAFCSVAAIDYMKRLLADPANDVRTLKDISGQISVYGRNYVKSLFTAAELEASKGFEQRDDPVNKCVPSGFNFADASLPIKITQFKDRVLIHYEFWSSERVVYTDGRDHRANIAASRLGDSIGWYDGSSLIVETVAIAPHLTYWADGARSSIKARAYERYSRSEDGSRLIVEKTLVDPVMLRRPLTSRESRLSAPNVQIMQFQCDTRYVEGFLPKQ